MSRRPTRPTTCIVDLAAVRAEPHDAAEQVTQVLRGERVVIHDERDGWAHIRTTYDYPGWVRADALASGDPVAEARAYLGTPYEWGGLSERGMDCSGLVHMAFRRVGVTVPRDADQQEDAAEEVSLADARPGDLATYGDEAGADHIAFWLGGGVILHATGRRGVSRVVEEQEPSELRARRRKLVRLASLDGGTSPV